MANFSRDQTCKLRFILTVIQLPGWLYRLLSRRPGRPLCLWARIILLALISGGVFSLSQIASARNAGGPTANAAGSNCLHGTMYDVAVEKPGVNFRRDVALQGTGIKQDGTVVQWTKKRLLTLPSVRLDPDNRTCDSKRGEVIGASGYCLLPFFSVSADPAAGYQMGDIIYAPDLKGTEIRLPPPPGKEPPFLHPGYFIVGDTGGAIKGRGRFDFFTGTLQLTDSGNAFGYSGTGVIGQTTGCQQHFELIQQGTALWQEKMTMINNLYDQTINPLPAPTLRSVRAPGVTR